MLKSEMREIKFEESCFVTCTDSGVGNQAQVHKFKNEDYLEIVIQGVVVPMPYNKKGLYIGNKFGMEFTTRGPKSYTLNRN